VSAPERSNAEMFQPAAADEGTQAKGAPRSNFALATADHLAARYGGTLTWGAYRLVVGHIDFQVEVWRPHRLAKEWFELVAKVDAAGLPIDDSELLLACLGPKLSLMAVALSSRRAA
jgi:hypothetical protein